MIRNFIAAAICAVALPAFALTTGQPAPDFTLKGADGKDYKLSQFKGKTVVLEWWNKDCPYVKKFYDSKTMQALQKENVDKGVIWLSINSSAAGKEGAMTPADVMKFRKDKGINNTAILLDAKGEVGKLYSAKTTPHMFIVDKDGKLVYQGAIDDQPSANEQTLKVAKNYVSTALMALNKGEAIKENSTTPYGCSVKY